MMLTLSLSFVYILFIQLEALTATLQETYHQVGETNNWKSGQLSDRCVIVLANQNGKLFYSKFFQKQNCVYVLKKNDTHLYLATDPVAIYDTFLQLDASSCTVIAAMGKRRNLLLAPILAKTHLSVPHLTQGIHTKLVFSKQAMSTSFSCSTMKHIYTEAITMLIKNLPFEFLSIIVQEDDGCHSQLAQILADEVTKTRSQRHSSDFLVKIYKLPLDVRGTDSRSVLLSIRTEGYKRRVYIMLTPREITSNFFETSISTKMNTYNDIWIVKQEIYRQDIIPVQTIAFSGMTYKEYQPINHEISTSVEGFDAICPQNMPNNSTSRLMEQYVLGNATKEIITITIWWRNSWKALYDIAELKQIFSISIPANEFRLLVTLGFNQRPVLKVVSVKDGPFLFTAHYLYDTNYNACEADALVCHEPVKQNSSTIWRNTCCYGYSVDLIHHLANSIGFSPELYIVEDGKYGGFDSNLNEFNGMIGDVIKLKADMAVAGLTINTDRLKHVDFTVPFMQAEIGIITLKKIESRIYLNFHFIANLGANAPYAIGAIYMLAFIFIFLFDNSTLYYKRKYDHKFRGSSQVKTYSWLESFTYTSGLLFQRDIGGINPSTKGGRTTALFFAFSMVTATTLYTASLTANRVVQNTNGGFLGLKDKRMTNPTDAFKFATSRHTSIEAFFKNAPDPTLNRMYRFMLKYNVKNTAEGINAVLNGDLQAYLNEYPFLKYNIAQNTHCTLELYENSVGQDSYGIAVAKNSPLQSVLSQALIQMQENGLLLKLTKKWLANDCTSKNNGSNQFSLHFFAMPLLMLAIMIGVCFFILILEILVWKLTNKTKGKNLNTEEVSLPQSTKYPSSSIRRIFDET